MNHVLNAGVEVAGQDRAIRRTRTRRRFDKARGTEPCAQRAAVERFTLAALARVPWLTPSKRSSWTRAEVALAISIDSITQQISTQEINWQVWEILEDTVASLDPIREGVRALAEV